MPGLTGSFRGQDEKLRFVREDSYGTLPGSPSWQAMPFLEDGVDLGGAREHYRPNVNIAPEYYADETVIPHRDTPDGTLTTLPYPEIAGFLLNAGLERDGDGDLYSYQCEHYTPTDPRRYTGLVVDTLTITATGTGDGDVQLEIDWMGRNQEADDTISESDIDYSALTLVPFMFRDATLELNDREVADIDEFTITVENELFEGPNVGDHRGYIEAGTRSISVDLTKVQINDGFRQAARDGLTVSFEALFQHPDGHIMELQMPRLFVPETSEDDSPDSIVKENPTLEAAYDAGYGYDIDWGVDLGPSTTTLATITTTSSYFN